MGRRFKTRHVVEGKELPPGTPPTLPGMQPPPADEVRLVEGCPKGYRPLTAAEKEEVDKVGNRKMLLLERRRALTAEIELAGRSLREVGAELAALDVASDGLIKRLGGPKAVAIDKQSGALYAQAGKGKGNGKAPKLPEMTVKVTPGKTPEKA